eukprot:jgi/Psemu1/298263/fgenesh1_pm.516_\
MCITRTEIVLSLPTRRVSRNIAVLNSRTKFATDAVFVEYLRTTWGKQDPNEVVEKIAQGKFLPTQAFLFSRGHPTPPQPNGPGNTPKPKKDDVDYQTALINAGVIDQILEFLIQSNKDFLDVLPDAGKPDVIQCPSIWLQIVGCVCRDGFLKSRSLQTQIQCKVVNNIQGVFEDVSNFEERKFFGSRDSWIRSLLYFSALLRNLLTSENPLMANFLLKMPAIKQFLVRTLCIELGGIPNEALDEIRDFETTRNAQPLLQVIGFCQSYSAFAIKTVTETWAAAAAKKIALNKEDGSRKKKENYQNIIYSLLGEFAITPIAPGNKFMLGPTLVKLLETSTSNGWYQGGYSSTMFLFLKLYDWGGRLSGKFGVDCVSSNLVPVCLNYLLKHASTKRTTDPNYFFENISTGLVVLSASLLTPFDEKGRQAPIDYNVARAVYNGLLEYCCDICDACNDNRFTAPLEKFLKLVLVSACLPLTRAAIRSKAEEICAKIERVKERPPFLFSCLPLVEKIVEAAVLEEKGTIAAADTRQKPPRCEFCGEKCGDDNLTKRKCPFCKSVVYCSSNCLRLNFMLHKKGCMLLRKYPAPKLSSRLIVQEGKELFTTNLQKILLQASLKGFSILFCLVIIDMAEATPMFRTLTLEQFLQSYKILEDDVLEQFKATFERNRAEGALTVSMIGFSEEGLSISMLTFPPEAAPTHFGPAVSQAFETDKWTAAQREVAKITFRTPEDLKKLQRNKDIWMASILKSMKP